MKSIRFARKPLLCLTAVAALAIAAPSFAQTIIDFSSSRGTGSATNKVLIENIRVVVPVPNPFDPASSTTATTTYNVTFQFDPTTLHLIPAGIAPVDGSTNCAQVNVRVYDALLGQLGPIANAVVTLGTQTATTNSSGVASFSNATSGAASLAIAASNYTSATQSASLSCSEENTVAVALSPANGTVGGLTSGQFRVVTTWGEQPYDLDSHMTGPSSTSGSRWHVYYGDQTSGDMCGLDVDDTSSFGPETITCPLTNTTGTSLRPGIYRYSVHHYSGSGTIGTSNANVRLQFEDGTVYNYTPPSTGNYAGSRDVWTVFELTVNTNGSIAVAPVNTITSSVGASSVRSANQVTQLGQFGRAEDPAVFRTQGPK